MVGWGLRVITKQKGAGTPAWALFFCLSHVCLHQGEGVPTTKESCLPQRLFSTSSVMVQ